MSLLKGFVVGDAEVKAKFERMPDEVQAALKQGITRGVLMLQVRAKQKLNGEVLKVKTGRLRRSINTRVTEDSGQVVGIVGTNVEYARAHEYGFTGTVSIREHLRRAVSGKMTQVRAHSRHVNLPEKSFLRTALAELEPDIANEINQAINNLLKQSR